jgi:hypothetical protein
LSRSKQLKKKKRRLLPILLLISALILTIAFVLLLPVIEEKVPSKTAEKYEYNPTYRMIETRDCATLASIAVTHVDGDSYTLLYQNGSLALQTGDGAMEEINPAYTEKFLQYATEITVEDTVTDDVTEVEDSLSDMGLLPPQAEVLVTYADGTAVTLSFGYAMTSTTYYYFRWSGDDGVYLCNSGAYETFEYTAEMLLSVTQPEILASLIERISIARGDGDPIVCAFTADAEGNVLSTVQSPFVYPMNSEAADTLRTAAENFRLGSRLKPVTDDNRAQYGLDTPLAVITIDQREGLYSMIDSEGGYQTYTRPSNAITLTIGNPDGEFFYFCEYEGTCYRVSSFLLTAFLSADANNYLTNNPADMDGETLQGVSVQTGSGTLDFSASYTEQVLPNNELATDESGNVLYTQTVTMNGETITADAFNSLVERLGQMTVSGKLDSIGQPEGAPLWQMTLTTTQGISRTLAAYPMDAFQDVLAVDGVALHYISKEALDIALGEFAALPDTAEPQTE